MSAAEKDPRSKLGEEVAAQMDAIEADFGDNYEIGNVVTIVEVLRPDGAGIRVRCNQQPWIGLGLLQHGPQRIGERVRAYDPVRDGDVEVEVCHPTFVDPERVRLHG